MCPEAAEESGLSPWLVVLRASRDSPSAAVADGGWEEDVLGVGTEVDEVNVPSPGIVTFS
jgi:hypothetical protein